MRVFKRPRVVAKMVSMAEHAIDEGKSKAEVAAILTEHAKGYKVKWETISALIKIILSLFFVLLLMAPSPASAQCPGGVCRAPLAIPAPAAPAPKADCQCDGCECAAPARPVIRSTYQPMRPRWRPLRRVFGR